MECTSIEVVGAKLLHKLHKITLHELNLVLKTSVFGMLLGTGNLVLVVVQANDVHIGEASNFSCRTANTATYV